MGYFIENLECIKNNRKFMYDKWNEFAEHKPAPMLSEIKSIPSIKGGNVLCFSKNNQEYRLNSLYFPEEEAKIWADQFSFINMHNVIEMFGLGNGIIARQLIDKLQDEDRLIIYEPCSDVFMHILDEYDITDILSDKRVSISVKGINDFEFHNVLMTTINGVNIKNQTFCTHPHYNGIFQYDYRDFLNELKENNMQARVTVNTGVFLGERMIKYSLNNIKYLSQGNSLPDFIGDFSKDIPAIIVAAGPSVKKNVNDLKRAKGKAVIFAVDRILDFLIENGVKPDFVLTLAPIKETDMFSTKGSVDIPIITTMEANPEILDLVQNKKIICECNSYIATLYMKLNKAIPKVPTGISVATLGFSICKLLGFETIILVGQDLAYDDQGNSHASAIKEAYVEENVIMVEDIYGNQVKSRYDWYRMLIWYQDMLQHFPDVKLVDATEGGAKIKGSKIMKLSDAIQQYCNNVVNCSEIVANKKPSFNLEKLSEFLELLKEGIKEMDQIDKKVIEGKKLCKDIEDTYKKKHNLYDADYKKMEKVSKINSYIEGKTINKLIDLYVNTYTANQMLDVYKFTGDEILDQIKTIQRNKLIYETSKDAIKFIRPLLQNSIKQMECELEDRKLSV